MERRRTSKSRDAAEAFPFESADQRSFLFAQGRRTVDDLGLDVVFHSSQAFGGWEDGRAGPPAVDPGANPAREVRRLAELAVAADIHLALSTREAERREGIARKD